MSLTCVISLRDFTKDEPITMSNCEPVNRIEPFDVLEDSNIQNPFPLFTKLRSEAPVYWNQKYSFWMVSRYCDVKWILQQPHKFSSVTKGMYMQRREELPQNAHA